MSVAEWTDTYGIHHWRILWSSYRKLAWVGFEPMISEFRSDALTDWAIRPWVQYNLHAYIYIYIYTYMYVCMYNKYITYIYIYVCVCIYIWYTCMYIYIYITSIHIYVYINSNMLTQINAFLHMIFQRGNGIVSSP